MKKCKHIWAHEQWCANNRIGDADAQRYPAGLYNQIKKRKEIVKCDAPVCALLTHDEFTNLQRMIARENTVNYFDFMQEMGNKIPESLNYT